MIKRTLKEQERMQWMNALFFQGVINVFSRSRLIYTLKNSKYSVFYVYFLIFLNKRSNWQLWRGRICWILKETLMMSIPLSMTKSLEFDFEIRLLFLEVS